MKNRPRIGLALSGGLAWGLAHLGVIKVIEEEGLPVDVVAGTSVGSLVGALYASGYDYARLQDLARRTRWWDLLNLNTSRLGLVGMERLEAYLTRHLGSLQFGGLTRSLAVVACDLSSGEEVVFTTGAVARAVKASCALPGIFTPVEIEGKLLVDGGVVNNVPVGAARSLGAELVIAVDVGANPLGWPSPAHVFQVILQSIIIMQREKVRQALAAADVVVQPQVEGLSLLDLEHPAPYIEAGSRAAEAALPRIYALLEA